MAQQNRNYFYTGPLSNGARPDEDDFLDFMESTIFFQDDPISLDTEGNFVFDNGVQVGNTDEEAAGMIRYRNNLFEFREGASWVQLNQVTGGGAFEEVDGGPDVAFNGGNVGIGTGTTSAPDSPLQVRLGNNNGAENQVRFGNAAIHHGNTSNNTVYFSHNAFANDSEYAVSQNSSGDVSINSADGRSIQFRINNSTGAALVINPASISAPDTAFIVGSNAAFPSRTESLHVLGDAVKTVGGTSWNSLSDSRVKKAVQPFFDGINLLKQINPVSFQYNGKGGTQDGDEQVGILAQDMQEIAPYMVSSIETKLNPEDEHNTEILTFNPSSLIYIAINAIKQMSEKIEQLESQLANGNQLSPS